MKTTIAILITVLSLATTKAADDLFRTSEFNVSVFGGWTDKDDSTFAPGAGVSYFLTQQIGVGLLTHWDNFDGKLIDNLSGEVYFRMPLADVPLAPYGVAAVGYSFETEETFESIGGGAEWRLNDQIGIFGDVRWQINNDTDDGIALRAGVRFVF
jgi:hypothetical protein